MKEILYIGENNNMSLSCKASIEITDRKITEIKFKGMPRAEGDGWVHIVNSLKVGSKIEQSTIDRLLKYNGRYNVKASLVSL